jgi:chromosome segregation ATPase
VTPQVNEMQTIHDTSKSKLEKLTERVRSQGNTISMLEEHLSASKQREEALELSLKERLAENEAKGSEEEENEKLMEGSLSKKETEEEEEEGVVHEPSGNEKKEHPTHQMLSQLLTNSQTRCKELESELADAKANMDELIVEIESVATEEEKTRTQNSRLLKQINEGHNVHKAVLQENLRLHQDITTLQEKESLANTKSAPSHPPPLSSLTYLYLTPALRRVENISSQMKILESTLQQLRQAEHVARSELSSSAAILSELRVSTETQQKKIEELEAKLQQTLEESQKYQQRLQELKERCNLLTTNCEEERNKRSTSPPFLLFRLTSPWAQVGIGALAR